jgi:predicted O-methyltransferase YrrM
MMPLRSLLPEAVERYVAEEMTRQTPVQRSLRAETASLESASMQIGPDEAALLSLLVRLLGARRALEIGTFTGMSALAVASALPADGRLVCCDVNDGWTSIARRYWDEAGLGAKIDLRLGPARDTLAALLRQGEAGAFDFAFIDADKLGYEAYYEDCLLLLRTGGIVALDNMLWSGSVADPGARDPETIALRALNKKIRDDPRVEACLLTVGDGVVVARKNA